jgi:transcriptional regulator with XRE-family HTH domain
MTKQPVNRIVVPKLKMGDRLRVIRREYLGKLTQAEMADLLGVPRERYAQWESGGHEPRPAEGRRIANLLEHKAGVSAAWTLGVKDNAGPSTDDDGGAGVITWGRYVMRMDVLGVPA